MTFISSVKCFLPHTTWRYLSNPVSIKSNPTYSTTVLYPSEMAFFYIIFQHRKGNCPKKSWQNRKISRKIPKCIEYLNAFQCTGQMPYHNFLSIACIRVEDILMKTIFFRL